MKNEREREQKGNERQIKTKNSRFIREKGEEGKKGGDVVGGQRG